MPGLTKEDELYWLALRLIPGLGVRRAGQLLDAYHGPQAIFRASRSELEAAGITGSVAQSVASGCSFEDAAAMQQKMLDAGAVLITRSDERYPPRLGEIYDPPIVLFARGRVEILAEPMIGVVGTRRPTTYGTAVTERIAADLARSGLVISSGMARGIDTAAHQGALEAGGGTVAVFGCGVDVVYPAENRKLASQLAEKGLLLSEFPMGSPAYPQNFPVRNRIISGMSLGILVVEGAQYSGSSITARLALDQGREVFAVPGNVTSKVSWGPNLLIKQGAKLVQDYNDVVVELAPEVRRRLVEKSRARLGVEASEAPVQGELPLGPSSDTARAVLDLLRVDQAIHLDAVLEKLERCSASELIAVLFELEMLGLVKQLPGKNFVKVW
jgi:DNA processing protein